MPNDPGIAVIMPAYNVAPYIDQALASVASQTVPAAAVIVADDASTDDTVERALRWRNLLPLEIIRLKRNIGPGLARHQAILATDMPLLAAFDADDVLLADHLEALWTAYEHAPGIATAQEWDWIPDRGIDAERRRRPSPIPTDATEQLLWVLQANWITNPLFPRALYDQVGGFREEFFWGEDWDLWIRMVRDGAWITGTDHPTLLRRVRSDSLTADKARNAQFAAAVLAKAVAEAQSPIEREVAERALGVMQARERYYGARVLAQRGHPWQARREAVRGLRRAGAAVATHLKIAVGLTSMIAAPRITLQLEQATRRHRMFSAEY